MNKVIIAALCNVVLFRSVWATEPVTISEPTPAIESIYYVGESTVVTYTVTNNVPGQGQPLIVSGISDPVSRTSVINDCDNILPPGPAACHIGIMITPTANDLGKTITQNLTVNYGGRTPLVKEIHFSVQQKIPEVVVLKSSVPALALAVSGAARTITITSEGANAHDVSYEVSPALPEGTTIKPDTCGDLNTGQSCVLTITPGSAASVPAGAEPNPSMVKVHATNSDTTLTVPVSIVTVGSILQQGYIFAINDTTPVTQSVGGSVVSLADNSAGIQWYNGNSLATGATSGTDGAANTAMINSIQGNGNYAAAYCASYQIDSAGNAPCVAGNQCYQNWYLPAICQLGHETNGSGCPEVFSNVEQNLVAQGIGGFSAVHNYWSSTEFSTSPNGFAWYQYFGNATPTNPSFHGVGNKYVDFFVLRCARNITP